MKMLLAAFAVGILAAGCGSVPETTGQVSNDAGLVIYSGERFARMVEGRTICYEGNDSSEPLGCETFYSRKKTVLHLPDGTRLDGGWRQVGTHTCFNYVGDPTEHCFVFVCDANGNFGGLEWPLYLGNRAVLPRSAAQAAFEDGKNVRCR